MARANGPRLALLPPQGYLEMLGLMAGAKLVLTDSGGVQEETTALAVPCLTMRDNTERPITVDEGTNTLVGRDRALIAATVDEILRGGGKRGRRPELWDGRAAPRIARHLAAWLAGPRHRARRGGRMSARAGMPSATIVNALTVDVEDYFQVSAFESHIARSDWDRLPCRVEANIDRILAMLDAHARTRRSSRSAGSPSAIPRWCAGSPRPATSSQATEPSTGVRATRRATSSSPTFAARRTLLEELTGSPVRGYRAPSFSVGPANPWAFECIARGGLSVQLERLSDPSRSLRRARPRRGSRTRCVPGLLELPVATVRMLNTNWPAGGGGYFRLLPYRVSQWSLDRIHRQRRPARDVLFPSVGDRSRPAARRGRLREDPFPPLPESRSHAASARPAAARLSLGSRRSRLSRRGALMSAEAVVGPHAGARRRRCRVRAFRRADAARWDAFVARCAERDVLPPHRLARDPRGGVPAPHALPVAERGGDDRRRAAARRGEKPAVRTRAGVAAVLRLRRARRGRRRSCEGAGRRCGSAGPRAARRARRAAQPRRRCATTGRARTCT